MLHSRDDRTKFAARQVLFALTPLSKVVENYLYDNEGRLQKLDGFPMMRFIYDNLPQRVLLKCSRKTLKSTLLSNIITLNMLRYKYYTMLYVAPQEISAKYFSQNYLTPRFESPALKRILPPWIKNDVFEKRLDVTHSGVILRYAKDDATRCRGPAVDSLAVDESVIGSTLVSTINGEKRILDIRPGDIVTCKDRNDNNIKYDMVRRWKSEGIRHTWRITLDSGEAIECTSRTRIFTNRGWLYLTQLLPKSEINRCEKARFFEAYHTSTASTQPSTQECHDGLSSFLLSLLFSSSKEYARNPQLLFHYGDYSNTQVFTESQSIKTTRPRSSIKSIEYVGEQEVFDIETANHHNFFANGILIHNCQDIFAEVLPIIEETMAMSPFKRQIYAGTPLTTDNTINEIWKKSTQSEWATKCGCGHWNTLSIDNEPLKMIRAHGLSCSKCGAVIDTIKGEWVTFNPKPSVQDNAEETAVMRKPIVGYHLAQPILPHYNKNPKEWSKIYEKVTDGTYTAAQIHNEVFGIAYDVGSKPITEEFLKTKVCVLGNMHCDSNHADNVYERGKYLYKIHTCGTDWGVNMQTSRTSTCMGALRDDGIFEVYFTKIYKDFDYEGQIKDVANRANRTMSFCSCDSGPDPTRGIKLIQLTSPTRTQMVRYEAATKFIQRFDTPAGAIDWRQSRWVLHRSDTMSFTFDLLKKGKILLPQWEDCAEEMQDILNIFIEVREGLHGRQDLFYVHKADKPDDFFHALNWAVCQAYVACGDPVLNGPSSFMEEHYHIQPINYGD